MPSRYISLGGGVQSTVVALMAAHGQLPPVSGAIFADTGWEPADVYTHLKWLSSVLPYPVITVKHPTRSLKDAVRNYENEYGRPHMVIPAFTRSPSGADGMHRRQCTSHWKIQLIRRALRAAIGYPSPRRIPPARRLDMLMGISTDEAHRMRDSGLQWIRNTYPLIDAGMSRQDCQQWFAARYPQRALVKSSCIGCPFHRAEEWLRIRSADPAGFAEACGIDAAMRAKSVERGRHPTFLHRRRVPLREAVELDQAARNLADAQGRLFDDFGEECEGVCGV